MIKNVVLKVDLWGWVIFFFSPMSGVGHQNFVPLRGGGSYFFEEPGFHFLRSTPPPVLFDQPLKSSFVLFHPSQRKVEASINLYINDTSLKEKDNIKYLGIIIDSNLN